MERELKQTKAELDARSSEIKTMQVQIERYKQDHSKLDQQLKEQRVSTWQIISYGSDLHVLFFFTFSQFMQQKSTNTVWLTSLTEF